MPPYARREKTPKGFSRLFVCRCNSIHFLLRNSYYILKFYVYELEHIEQDLRVEGVMDFFTQGTQVMWREHPLSKIHIQYTKNYKDIITKLESYDKAAGRPDEDNNPVGNLIGRVQNARSKYGQ